MYLTRCATCTYDQISQSHRHIITMKGLLLLAAVLAGLVAVHGDWDRNKVYKYEVKVKAFKYPDQWRNDPSGLYSRHHLTIRPYSDDVVIGQITQAEFVKGKPQRDNHDDSRSDNQDYADLDDGSFNDTPLSKPFKINLRNGVIQSLGVHNSMTTFEVNQLRLIVNQFQVDRNGQNVNSRSENRLPQAGSNAAFYKTMESNENCETVYDISPIPDYLAKSHPDWIPMPEINESNGEYIEIVKTKSSADCNGRRNVLSAASNYLSENGVSESDLSIVEKQRIVVSGSVHRFTIQSAISAIKLMHNRNRDIPLISVYVNATLESVESADRQSANLPDSLKIVQNLNYDFNPKMDEYQPIQPRQWGGGIGDESRFTPTCWTRFMWGKSACRLDFGNDWSFTGKKKNCGFLGLGINFECKRA